MGPHGAQLNTHLASWAPLLLIAQNVQYHILITYIQYATIIFMQNQTHYYHTHFLPKVHKIHELQGSIQKDLHACLHPIVQKPVKNEK